MAQNRRKGRGRGKAAERERSSPAEPERESIAFDYIKSNYFRVISVNGVVGGLSPNGDVHMALWSQRKPYPRQVVHEISPEGVLGKEIGRDQRDTLVREIEAGLVFNIEMALAMIQWLEKRVKEAAEHRAGIAALKTTGGKDGDHTLSADSHGEPERDADADSED